jgi:predicted nuclease with RNAse H fold
VTWFGADPGGINRFGVARLNDDGSFASICVSGVEQAISQIGQKPNAIGIDCPLWWSASKTGDRLVDRQLRRRYRIAGGTVATVNSLRGAVIAQGPMLAWLLAKKFGEVPITETHPKALLIALKLHTESWKTIASKLSIRGNEPASEHERDALLSAVVARNAFLKRWNVDLSLSRTESELDPKKMWFGSVSYVWPESIDGS